jgi:CBS domain-containing protein
VDDIEAVTVERVMTTGAVWVDGSVSLRSAAATLADAHIGAVIVRRDDGSPAMLSERDIVRALADGVDADTTTAADLAIAPLVTAEIDDHVSAVAARMRAGDLRHVVVVDRERVIGIVSVRDLLPLLED